MNKNTLLAFALIAITVIFFNSPTWNNFWYGTILKRPVPTTQRQQQQAPPANIAQDGEENSSALDESREHEDIAELPTESAMRESTESSAPSNENRRATPAQIEAQLARYRESLPDVLSESQIEILVAVERERLLAAPIDEQEIAQITEDTITVETDKIIAQISTKGARIISLKMKDYTYIGGPRKDELIDVLPLESAGGAQLSINDVSFDEKFFTLVNENLASDESQNESRGRHVVVTDDGFELALDAATADGFRVRKTFTFANGTYMLGYNVSGRGLSGRNVTLGWAGGVDDTEAGTASQPFGAGMDRRRAHYSDGRRVDHFEMKKRGVEEPSGMFQWVGMSSKYFFVAVAAERVFGADIRIEGRDVTRQSAQRRPQNDADIDYSVFYSFVADGDTLSNKIYAGPSSIDNLSRYKLSFEKSLFPVLSWARHILWADAWFPPLAEFILRVLQFFHNLVRDYGVAIFLLTLLSKVVTFPMTQSSMRSMNRMKDIAPKITALRQKYKSNPQKMNEEMMALYKAEGVNPFNPGCLPMFLQMPIFIALFVVLRKAIELRGASSFVLPWVKDLSLPEAFFNLPFAIPFYGSNFALMPIIMAALTYYQQKQTITDPNQKMLIYMMPILMFVMFNGFPAGVVFYWTVSSALGLVQQLWLKPKPKPAKVTVTVPGGSNKKRKYK